MTRRAQDSPAAQGRSWRAARVPAIVDTAWRAAVVVAVGVTAGLTTNLLRADGIRLGRYTPPAMCTAAAALPGPEPMIVPPADVGPYCAAPGTVIIDTRSALAYAHGHAAGALHLPCTASSSAAGRARELIGSSSTVVLYGDSTEDAMNVVSGLLTATERPDLSIVVVEGGFAAWQAANQPCSSGPCDRCEPEFFHERHH